MFHHGLREHRNVQLIGGLADVFQRAVFVEDVDGRLLGMISVVRRNALQQHEIRLLLRPAVKLCDPLAEVVDVVRIKGLFLHFDSEQMPVSQSSAKL